MRKSIIINVMPNHEIIQLTAVFPMFSFRRYFGPSVTSCQRGVPGDRVERDRYSIDRGSEVLPLTASNTGQ